MRALEPSFGGCVDSHLLLAYKTITSSLEHSISLLKHLEIKIQTLGMAFGFSNLHSPVHLPLLSLDPSLRE